MKEISPTIYFAAATALVTLGLLAWLVVRVWRRHRASPSQVIKRISADQLVDVLIPDGLDGEIHLDHALLTPTGILVVDLLNADGAVFGGEQMDDWTVLSQQRRYTFRNPLGPMLARVHAVGRLAGQIPVTGRVVFVGEVEFRGGAIPGAVTLSELEQEFGPADGDQARQATDAFHKLWERVSKAAQRYTA